MWNDKVSIKDFGRKKFFVYTNITSYWTEIQFIHTLSHVSFIK